MKNGYGYFRRHFQVIGLSKKVIDLVNSVQFSCIEDKNKTVRLIEDDISSSGSGSIRRIEKEFLYSVKLCGELQVQKEVLRQCGCLSTLLPVSHELANGALFCSQLPKSLFQPGMNFSSEHDTVTVHDP